jgi:hypothetical protein
MKNYNPVVAILFGLLISGPSPAQDSPEKSLEHQVAELREIVQKLQHRIDDLESKSQPEKSASLPSAPTPESLPTGMPSTTLNILLDGYYGYNFNSPIGRANLLRAYDVSSNAFSLNQAAIVIENAPDLSKGKRFGARLDLQFGQATQVTQGNAANEPRPWIYRNVFQAYGTYIIPAGSGLTVDFGKWASSLGIEGNYTQDQMNYSRSYWFDFLPFYHMGLRTNYKINDKLAASYWITNGTQQTEPFSGFKDQLFGLAVTPRNNINWVINYYLGQDHSDTLFFPNPGQPNLPQLQGLPFQPIPNAPDGHLHILDSYATWAVSPKLTFALEADYVIQRLNASSAPTHAGGGAGYARFQLTPKLALAGRAEYLSDHGGIFSGVTQALKESTFTSEYKLTPGFLLRGEWRRDFSNQPYFLTGKLGILKREQNTATLGVVLWFGQKEGAW